MKLQQLVYSKVRDYINSIALAFEINPIWTGGLLGDLHPTFFKVAKIVCSDPM